MLVWDHGSALQPCRCPLCRREITLLVPSDASSRQRDNNNVSEIMAKVERYNRHFAGHTRGLNQVNSSISCVENNLFYWLAFSKKQLIC